jgi:hypothetical protein
LGKSMRHVYGDTWCKGVHTTRSGIYEAMAGGGAFITDMRYANELIHGLKSAKKVGVPHRTIWMERPGVGPANQEEADTTSLMKPLADHIIHNDVHIKGLKENEWPESLEHAVITALATGRKEVKASEFA